MRTVFQSVSRNQCTPFWGEGKVAGFSALARSQNHCELLWPLRCDKKLFAVGALSLHPPATHTVAYTNMKNLLLFVLLSALPWTVCAQTAADSQRKAAVKYPELSKAGSPLNTKFIALVNEAKQLNPALLNDTN
jgi:hypothetical protein